MTKKCRCCGEEIPAGRVTIDDWRESAYKKPNPYEYPFQEWIEKTEFIQEWMNKGKLSPKYLGWHRADIIRDLLEIKGF